ncbi:hypothetical protein ACOMHN_061023 [Nucella lapillus]
MAVEKPTTDIEPLREETRGNIRTKQEEELAVNMEIENRRMMHRLTAKTKYQHLFIDAPRHTDFSFWMTRIGEAPKLGVPEEMKGIRLKTNKFSQFEVNSFRWHALQNFIYWLRKDDTLHLSPGLKLVPQKPCHRRCCQCNQCTGKRHPYL